MMPLLPAIELETGKEVDAAVIWLHGLGASGHDFEPIVPELKLPDGLDVRFIFPHAPEIPVTINGNYVMPAWYDILEMNLDRKVDEAQLRASADAAKAFIQREIERGISSDRIVIAGFSQGGAVAYETALSYDKPLAGVLALSTYFATADSIQLHEANRHIPIHISHGSADPVVPESLGQVAYRKLSDMGYQPEFSSYPMEHNVCLEQILEIGQKLGQWLK